MEKMLAHAIRFLAIDMVEKAKSGHPGMPMGMADVATILYRKFLKFNPNDPLWPDRDRFILSAGHGSALLYAILYLTGYKDMPLEQLKQFRQLGARTAGHPEYGLAAGIETSTGPLGQGLGNAVGMALAERMLNARLGDELINHKIYVVAGDGCLSEGISQEAISIAGHLKLKNLILLFDDNNITIDGPTTLSTSDDHLKRFEASNWRTVAIDGHNHAEITMALEAAQKTDKPVLIACRTKIGFGAPTKEGTASAHGSPLGIAEVERVRQTLNWPYQAFEVPQELISAWRSFGNRNMPEYHAWQDRFSSNANRKNLEDALSSKIPSSLMLGLHDLKEELKAVDMLEATRKSSERVIEIIANMMPYVVGGSADLTSSNNTKVHSQRPIVADDYSGSYIHYGVREHCMAAMMNGFGLHGGFIPYGGTFLAFTDYCRPAIRLAALMKLQVIYIMTHDSIGLGEDGPTHQPVEHLASLRAIPNLYVFRPCDVIETIECWEVALQQKASPSLLALTRQDVKKLRYHDTEHCLSAFGAYILKTSGTATKISIFATGSEVALAVDVAALLEEKGIGTTVVSVPCLELFKEQGEEYMASLLQTDSLKVAIEAGVIQGWEGIIGPDGIFIGMNDFGKSAPAENLFTHFGLHAESIAAKILVTHTNASAKIYTLAK